MTFVFKKPVVAALIALTSALFAGQAFAQADSTTAPRALQGRPIVLLQNQERETPQVTNTTNVTQQITQVVQPNTYQTASSGGGFSSSGAYASCGGSTLLSGGVTCDSGAQTTSVTYTQPSGNGWYGSCLASDSQWVTTTAFAVCSY